MVCSIEKSGVPLLMLTRNTFSSAQASKENTFRAKNLEILLGLCTWSAANQVSLKKILTWVKLGAEKSLPVSSQVRNLVLDTGVELEATLPLLDSRLLTKVLITKWKSILALMLGSVTSSTLVCLSLTCPTGLTVSSSSPRPLPFINILLRSINLNFLAEMLRKEVSSEWSRTLLVVITTKKSLALCMVKMMLKS